MHDPRWHRAAQNIHCSYPPSVPWRLAFPKWLGDLCIGERARQSPPLPPLRAQEPVVSPLPERAACASKLSVRRGRCWSLRYVAMLVNQRSRIIILPPPRMAQNGVARCDAAAPRCADQGHIWSSSLNLGPFQGRKESRIQSTSPQLWPLPGRTRSKTPQNQLIQSQIWLNSP